MPNSYDIELEKTADGGRYVMKLLNGDIAEMTFRTVSPNTISIDHTRVPDTYRGQGLAQLLVERGIADARISGTRIVPACSYVAAQFRRHPDWADLLAS